MVTGPDDVSPHSLNVCGATQPEIYRGTVDDMAQAIRTDPDHFWQEALRSDGKIEIWVINGERYLYNGNHRYQAALAAGAEIPDDMIHMEDRTGSAILTYRFDQMTWLPGRK